MQKQILALIRNTLGAPRHHGVVFVTHDLGVVAQICDRATLLYMGKVMEQGGVRDLLERPQHALHQGADGSLPRFDLSRALRTYRPCRRAVFAACRAEIAGDSTVRGLSMANPFVDARGAVVRA